MSLISTLAAKAFLEVRPFRRGNTVVLVRNGHSYLFLFGVLIALRGRDPGVFVSLRGHQTRTTLNRINAILNELCCSSALVTRRHRLRILDTSIYSSRRVLRSHPRSCYGWFYATQENMFSLSAGIPSSMLEGVCALDPTGSIMELSCVERGVPLPRSVDILRVSSNRPPPNIRKARVTPLPLP